MWSSCQKIDYKSPLNCNYSHIRSDFFLFFTFFWMVWLLFFFNYTILTSARKHEPYSLRVSQGYRIFLLPIFWSPNEERTTQLWLKTWAAVHDSRRSAAVWCTMVLKSLSAEIIVLLCFDFGLKVTAVVRLKKKARAQHTNRLKAVQPNLSGRTRLF